MGNNLIIVPSNYTHGFNEIETKMSVYNNWNLSSASVRIGLTTSDPFMQFNNSKFRNSSNITEMDPEILRIQAMTEALKQQYMWFIFSFGFPGNLVSFAVILRLRCFGSQAIYVATLAVVDNMAILVKLILLQVSQYKVCTFANNWYVVN